MHPEIQSRRAALVLAVALALVASCSESGEVGPIVPRDGGAASGGKGASGGTGGGSGGVDAGVGGSSGSSGAGGSGGTGGAAGADGGPPRAGWDPDYALPGVQGPTTSTVFAVVAAPGRKIYVGGSFFLAGDVPAKNIAVFNGDRWSAIGAGLDGSVQAMALASDESLYALTQDDNTGESAIHHWDGTSFTEIPTAADASIDSIDVGSDDTLYAGGLFTSIGGATASYLAKRPSGGLWAALPAGGPAESVSAVKAITNGVCAGGLIEAAAYGVTCLVGSQWQSRKGNLDIGMVRALTTDGDGTLYAAGNFMLTGISDGGGLARWTGSAWELVGGGLLGDVGQPDVYAVRVSGPNVYAAGFFSFAGGLFVRHVAMWNGTKWSDMNGGLLKLMGVDFIEQARGRAIAVDEGGEVYVGGRLTFAGSVNALRIARWDGADWNAVDDPNAVRLGVNGGLNALFVASDGSVYVGGAGFQYLGGDVAANDVARLDPSGRWYPLGAGLNGVLGFAEREGEIYAVGSFDTSGPGGVRYIARWDGATWVSVGGGLDAEARTIARGPDGKLYVGGAFTLAGGIDAKRVAVWDGATWSAVGTGVGEDGETVDALGFDTQGRLYAGGQFTTAGGAPASNVAMWDGSQFEWRALGDGVDLAVNSMAFYKGRITIGGQFEKSGTADVPHLAAWDGSVWRPVGGGLVPENLGIVYVQGLGVRDDELYAVGIIEKAGAAAVSHIARWDGTTWSDVEGGLDDVVEDIAITPDSLWVGGVFTRAGGYGSTGIGRYWFRD